MNSRFEKYFKGCDSLNWIFEYNNGLKTVVKRTIDIDDETLWFPANIGIGRVGVIPLEEGLAVYISDGSYHQQVTFTKTGTKKCDYYQFYFEVGETNLSFLELKLDKCQPERPLCQVNEKDKSLLHACFFSSNVHVKCMPPVKGKYTSLSIIMSRQWLLEHIQESKLIPNNILMKDTLKGNGIISCPKLTFNEINLVRDIISGEHEPYMRRMHVKAYTLLLISDMFRRISNTGEYLPEVKKNDMEGVTKAHNALISDLKNAKPIFELSRMAMMSVTKFKRIFKQVYGTSCYNYYKKRRMEAAKEMFDNGETGVATVAFQLGYNSLSHFSKIFRQHFSIPPSEYIHQYQSSLRYNARMLMNE